RTGGMTGYAPYRFDTTRIIFRRWSIMVAMTPQDTPPEDPRRERSRSRLLDATTALLTSGGVDAVTIESVTRVSKVARSTLYRHFDGSAALVTAAFERLLPPIAEP